MTDPKIDAIDLSSLSPDQLTELLSKTQKQIEDNERRQRKVAPNDKDVNAVAKQIKALVDSKVVLLETFVEALLQNLEIQPASEVATPPEKPESSPEKPAASTQSRKPRASSKKKSPATRRTRAAKPSTTKKPAPSQSPPTRTSGKIGLSNKDKAATTEKKAPRTPPVRTIKAGKKEVTVKNKRVFGQPKRYVHPDDSDLTWEGVGKRPAWVVRCLESGLKLEDLAEK